MSEMYDAKEKEKVFYKIAVVSIYVVGIIGFLIEVLNPHSFLSYSGALLRVALLLTALPLWILWSKRLNLAPKNPGTIAIVLLIFIYGWGATSLFCEDYAWNRHIEYPFYSCPAMLFR